VARGSVLRYLEGVTERALRLLEEARRLTQEERDLLAAELRRGPFEPQESVDAAWKEEIERRLKDVQEGRAKTVPAREAIAELREELRRRR
jgi:hypothetical protein